MGNLCTLNIRVSAPDDDHHHYEATNATHDVAEQLFDVDPKEISKVPLQNELIEARVYKVYDGDTCSILYKLGDRVMKTSLRIVGIDCPELRPKRLTEEMKVMEAKAAAVCRDFVKSLILEKIVQVMFVGNDKYGGRLLANIYIPGDDLMLLSDVMITQGYAKPYDGAKKEPWTYEELNRLLKIA